MKFLLEQYKEHVEAHNTIMMQSYQWARMHKLLITQFLQESGRKVKFLSDKWEKLRNTYSKIKKLRNQRVARVWDDGANSYGMIKLTNFLISLQRPTVF